MIGWDDPRNAKLYDEFARDYPLYADASRDLVDLAHVTGSDLVVDLACGTGVTTETILARLDESAEVVALDASEAMLAIARRRVTDRRVRWVRAPAVNLPEYASGADAIVCNSAIWQLDMERAIGAAAEALKPRGRLVFNIGSRFLMLPSGSKGHRSTKPTFVDVIQSIAVLRCGFAPRYQAAPRRRPLTPDAVSDMLSRAGLVAGQIRKFEYDEPPEAQLAWFRVPIFAQNVLPGMPYEKQLEVLAKAYERWDKSSRSTSVWFAFVSHKR